MDQWLGLVEVVEQKSGCSNEGKEDGEVVGDNVVRYRGHLCECVESGEEDFEEAYV